MRESDILKQFFQDQLGDGYNVGAFRNAVADYAPSTEVMRVIRKTDDIIAEMIADKTIRAVLRTSQSDYIGLRNTDGASFTWSLEFAAPVDSDVDGDVERIRQNFTEKIIPVEYKSKNYELLLTFAMPAKFAAVTINGTNYLQLVWGGRATITENSVLANQFEFLLDNKKINGIISFSFGNVGQGENYTTWRGEVQKTALQTCVNSISFTVHALKTDPFYIRLRNAAVNGDFGYWSLQVKDSGTVVAFWPDAKLDTVEISGSIGSYAIINTRFLRS